MESGKIVNDTKPAVLKIIAEGYRNMTSVQKMKSVTDLTRNVLDLALTRIRKQYGAISHHEEQLHLAALWLDRDTMIKVFNWDPREKGY